MKSLVFAVVLLCCVPVCCSASGHGPLFGLSTPVGFEGKYQFDFGSMSRRGAISTDNMLRWMISYGITSDLAIGFSFPYAITGVNVVPGRTAALMSATTDAEITAAWRFYRHSTGVGSRWETTVFGGVLLPSPQQAHDFFGDHRETRGLWTGISAGYLTRSQSLFAGIQHSLYSESDIADERPSQTAFTLSYGLRPFKKEYPAWDWRVFAELTGEHTNEVQHHGAIIAESGGEQVLLGPSILGLYKNIAVSAGVQFPIYRNVGEYHEKELARFGFNMSYIF